MEKSEIKCFQFWVLVLLRTVMYVMVMVIVFVAYRAILAEPRTKAATTDDYPGGAARVDYMGGNDSMNQYALPLGTQLFDCIINYLLDDSSKDVIIHCSLKKISINVTHYFIWVININW